MGAHMLSKISSISGRVVTLSAVDRSIACMCFNRVVWVKADQ